MRGEQHFPTLMAKVVGFPENQALEKKEKDGNSPISTCKM